MKPLFVFMEQLDTCWTLKRCYIASYRNIPPGASWGNFPGWGPECSKMTVWELPGAIFELGPGMFQNESLEPSWVISPAGFRNVPKITLRKPPGAISRAEPRNVSKWPSESFLAHFLSCAPVYSKMPIWNPPGSFPSLKCSKNTHLDASWGHFPGRAPKCSKMYLWELPDAISRAGPRNAPKCNSESFLRPFPGLGPAMVSLWLVMCARSSVIPGWGVLTT